MLDVDGLDWFTAKMYAGLLENNASDTNSGAGQDFTSRPLIDAIVE